MTTLLKRLPVNEKGRDLVVGDVHGCFDAVRGLMQLVEFDPEADRLICVGDLVDRGPDSDECLSWLDQPWFHSVMGNHEMMAMMAWGGGIDEVAYRDHGGGWFLDLEEAAREEYARAFATLPLAIEVATPTGRVGIVHADLPPEMSWPALAERLEAGDRTLASDLLWSRRRFEEVAAGRKPPPIVGVERVFAGHTVVRRPSRSANVFYTDLGFVFGGELLILGLDGVPIASVTKEKA